MSVNLGEATGSQRKRPGKIVGLFPEFVNTNDQNQAEIELAESEERYRALIENSPDGVCLFEIRSGKFLFLNECICTMFGYSITEAFELTVFDAVNRDNRDGLRKAISGILIGKMPRVFTFEADRRNGEQFNAEISLALVTYHGRLCAQGIVRDVTERLKAESALQESQERYRAIVEQTTDSILLIDVESSCIVSGNPAACQLLGYEPDELHNLKFSKLVLEDNKFDLLRAVPEGSQFARELKLWRKDGLGIVVEVKTDLIIYGGRRVISLIARDLSERLEAEEHRKSLEIRVQQAQKLESLGQLAAGIAHDFNNLLVGIIGNVDLSLTEVDEGTRISNYLNQIRLSAERAAEIANQMLTYTGRCRIVLQPLSISRIIRKLSSSIETAVPENISVTYDLSESLPHINADNPQFQQALLNIMINAVESIGTDEGNITLRTGVIHLDNAYIKELFIDEEVVEGEYVFVEVIDDGCGMDEDMQHRIFDPFYTTKFLGRGLGLAAVLGIMRGHRGTIRLESNLDTGTSMTLFYPASHRKAKFVPPNEQEALGFDLQGTVLVIDDEETVLSVTKHMLEFAGAKVITADNGESGVDLFRERTAEIDCILLDYTMPGMMGDRVFDHVRRIKKDIPVILMSGYTKKDVAARFGRKGLTGFIQKPYNTITLVEVISRCLLNI